MLALAAVGGLTGMVLAQLLQARSAGEILISVLVLPAALLLPFRPDLVFPVLVALTPHHGLLAGTLLGIPGLDLLNLILLAGFLGLMAYTLRERRRLKVDLRILGPMALVLFLMMVAIVRGRLRPGAPPMGPLLPFVIDYFVKPALPLGLLFLGLNMPLRHRHVRWGLYALVAVGGLVGLWYLWMLSAGDFVGLESRVLAARGATLGGYGPVVALTLPFLVVAYFQGVGRFGRTLILVAAVVAGITLMYSYTRAAYIAAVLGVAVMAIVQYRRLIWIGALVLITAPLWMPGTVWTRIASLEEAQAGLISLSEVSSGRIDIWMAALTFVRANLASLPFGGGSGIFTQYSEVFSRLGGPIMGWWDVHNYFLETLTDKGLVGLAAYLWLLGASLRLAWGVRLRAQDALLGGLGLACTAYVVAGLGLSFFSSYNLFTPENSAFWLFLGLLAAQRLGLERSGLQPKQSE